MRIAIIGGGCSGSLVAFHLLRNGFRGPVTMIEPRAELGRGVAYSTGFDGHLLNVAAGKMSAVSAEPSHFVEWLRARGFPGADGGVFAPRRLYGEYLSGLLQEQLAENGAYFGHVRSEAASIACDGGAARLKLRDGSTIEAERVVLALGNPVTGSRASAPPAGLEDVWEASPWAGDGLRLRKADERILLLGAGQTAVDAVLSLQSQAGGCRIQMLSRSGLMTQAHTTNPASMPAPGIRPEHGLRPIVRELRAQMRRAAESGATWQAVIDSLRPISNEVWRGLPLEERRRFLRHLKAWWETHRSRMAPQVGSLMERYCAEGRVETLAGRLRGAERKEDGIEVLVALRKGGERRLRVDRVIDCTGIHEYYHVRPRPLIAELLRQGLARANDLGIGFQADANGALEGPASGVLFTLGPPRRGDLFETIAVPEIRVQAEALAAHLMSSGG